MLRRFSLQVVIRVTLLLVTTAALGFIFGDERLLFNHLLLAIVIMAQTVELIVYVTHTNRELSRFFNAIRYKDFSASFRGDKRGPSFRELAESMNAMTAAFREVKGEKEAQYHFLLTLVDHLQVGVMAFHDDATMTLMNPATEKLLGINGIKGWRDVRQQKPEFARQVDEMDFSGRRLISLTQDGDEQYLSVDACSFTLLERRHVLVTIQNINSEIEEKEIEAWHRLIRILTHEIMNSVTPVSSLTETLLEMLRQHEADGTFSAEATDTIIPDLRFSLETIQKRSDGLLNFVDRYRRFARVPKPSPERLSVSDLFDATEHLMRAELASAGIRITKNITGTASPLFADKSLIEQVMLNLVGNSIHALEKQPDPHIILSSSSDDQFVTIGVTDNGVGISARERSEIFVPFFTTRKDGSGIGLSLTKQIVSAHQGHIKVISEEGRGATFLLRFPCRPNIQPVLPAKN